MSTSTVTSTMTRFHPFRMVFLAYFKGHFVLVAYFKGHFVLLAYFKGHFVYCFDAFLQLRGADLSTTRLCLGLRHLSFYYYCILGALDFVPSVLDLL
jgi:hypothetical protein